MDDRGDCRRKKRQQEGEQLNADQQDWMEDNNRDENKWRKRAERKNKSRLHVNI